MIVQRFMPPVKFITHDDQKNPDVKEPLKEENGEIEKPQNESQTEIKLSPNNELDKTADEEFENYENTHAHAGFK